MIARSARELVAEARLLRSRAQYTEGASALEAAVKQAEREEGVDGSTVGEALIELCTMRVLASRGAVSVQDESVALAERGVAVHRKWFGPHDLRLANALRVLGTLQAAMRLNEALQSLREAVEIFDVCEDYGGDARLAREWLTEVALRLGHYGDAHRAALGWMAGIPNEERVESLFARKAAGRSLLGLGRPLEALLHLREAARRAADLDRENGWNRFTADCATLVAEAETAVLTSE